MSPAPAVDEVCSEDWAVLAERCPQLAATMRRYLAQQAVTLAPRTIEAADGALRRFGLWVSDHDPTVTGATELSRHHIEAFKIHCHTATNARTGKPFATNTVRQRLRLLKVFFDRIIEWGYSDAPARNPVIHGDVPPRPEPLPKFLDDASMARFMHEATVEADPLRRLCVLLLARTAMRASELSNLGPDPVVQIGEHHWLPCRWESSATTATSPCTPTWSGSSPPGRPTTPPTSPATAASWPTSRARSGGTGWPAWCNGWRRGPGWGTSTLTVSVIPLLPRPSTGGCDSRRWLRCWATRTSR